MKATFSILIFAWVAVCGAAVFTNPQTTRPINLPEETEPNNNDVVVVDRDGEGTRKMKLQTLINAASARQSVATLSDLGSLTVSTNGQVMFVRGFATALDWGEPRPFLLDTSSSATTNLVTLANAGGSGRWIHPWDGNAAALGILPSTNDCGVRLTSGAALAASLGVPFRVEVAGDYHLTTTAGFQYGSGSHIRFGPNVWLVGNYEGSSGGYADPAKAYVRNTGVTGWPSDGELSITVSNVFIDGLKLRGTGFTNYGFVAFNVGDAQWSNFQIKDLTAGWAMNIAASNVLSSGHVIRTEGAIYQDGPHIIGGSKQLWTDFDVHSGDDAFAIGGPKDIPISDIIVQGAIVRSQFAHAVRINQERANSTNLFQRISFSDIVGESGQERNGQVRISSESTNTARPFRDITLRGIKVRGRSTGPPAIGVDYGFFIRDVDGISIEDCWSGETVYQNLWVTNAGAVVVNGFRGIGSRGTAFNQTVRFSKVDNLSVLGSTFLVSTVTTNTGIPVYFDGVGSLKFLGNTIVQPNSGQHAILFDGAASTNVIAANNAFSITGAGSPFGFSVNAANVVLTGNIGNGTNVVSWAGGSTNRPSNAVLIGNQGASLGEGAMNTFLPGKVEMAATATDWLFRIQRSGIATNDFLLTGARMTSHGLNGWFLTTDTTDGNTTKNSRFAGPHYSASEEPLSLLFGQSTSSSGIIHIGGGSVLGNAATEINLWGAADTTTTGDVATRAVKVSPATTANLLPIEVTVGSSNSLSRLKVGAAGTGPGGSGKAVYID